VATRLDTERALVLGQNLDRGLHIRRALRQDHAPGVLRRIGRVVGIDLRIVRCGIWKEDLALQLRVCSESRALDTGQCHS
jgi:hypothetical protein